MGGLSARDQGYIEPLSVFPLIMTITMIVMALFGGKGTIWGPVLGAVVLFAFQEVVWARFIYLHQLLFGAIIVGGGAADAPRDPGRAPAEVQPAPDHLAVGDAMAPILEIRAVVKRFGGVAAVNGVSLALEPGRIYGLIGPNGSGKTTLFNCITGVDQADEGEILFKGRRIDGLKPHQIFHLGMGRTFQVIRVFPELTALENLLVVTTAGYAEAERRARELLALVKLERLAGEFAGNLSYGQQKLVEFIRVLMTDPEMILLDEPAAGVNRTLLNELLDAVRQLRDQGKTVLLVEHDMKVVMGLCETVFVLDHGEKLAEGAPGVIQADERVIEAYFGR